LIFCILVTHNGGAMVCCRFRSTS